MNASFADVLARETVALASVSDVENLKRWRVDLVNQASDHESAYARVLQPAGDPQERAVFLDNWRDLIAAALARLVRSDARDRERPDPRQIAISVLAALYGGTVLSRVTRDSSPLRTSVELALAPLLLPEDTRSSEADRTVPSVP